MKILLIDNYDSFTYNLLQIMNELADVEVCVRRNDELRLEEIGAYDALLLSPGPGIPDEAGRMMEIIQQYAFTKPILGVCLGHQALAEAFGAKLENLKHVFHGVQSTLTDIDSTDELLNNLPAIPVVGRYHSWVVSDEKLPACLRVTARSPEGHIMALRHATLPIHGLQFHPESVLTPCGKDILRNWTISLQINQKNKELCNLFLQNS